MIGVDPKEYWGELAPLSPLDEYEFLGAMRAAPKRGIKRTRPEELILREKYSRTKASNALAEIAANTSSVARRRLYQRFREKLISVHKVREETIPSVSSLQASERRLVGDRQLGVWLRQAKKISLHCRPYVKRCQKILYQGQEEAKVRHVTEFIEEKHAPFVIEVIRGTCPRVTDAEIRRYPNTMWSVWRRVCDLAARRQARLHAKEAH